MSIYFVFLVIFLFALSIIGLFLSFIKKDIKKQLQERDTDSAPLKCPFEKEHIRKWGR